jgi:membrane protease YdiL (CAAX protease family)
MGDLASALISACLQVGVVMVVAALIYLVFGRKTGSFWRYIGIQPTTWGAVAAAGAMAIVFAAAAMLMPDLREMAGGEGTVVGKTAQGAFSASIVGVLAIKALLQTSLSEELFFRGLIAKRLINGLGFAWGNSIQAIIFAAVHLLLLLIPGINQIVVVGFVAFVGAVAWAWGWINEKWGRGSIIPSWIGHGLGNLLAYLGFAYLAST